jgi:Kelch motif
MLPQDGSGGWLPRPRNDSVASIRIASGTAIAICTTNGARQLETHGEADRTRRPDLCHRRCCWQRTTPPGPWVLSDRVEAYDPATNSWTMRAPMPTPRWDLTAVTLNGKIYAIGGQTKRDNTSQLGSNTDIVEVYDPATDSWNTDNCMITPRDYFAAATVDGRIFTIGGNIFETLPGDSIVEAFQPVTAAAPGRRAPVTKRTPRSPAPTLPTQPRH